MSESKRLFRGTMVLTFGRMAGYGVSFLRNLILARMLAKADYGLAATFGMAMTLLEISGRMAFGMQIIQSKQGDTPAFQASAHALQFIGGLCSALLIAALSVPMARLFGVPEAWWAFASLAVVPLFQGLGHLDVSRRQRDLDFLPLMLVDVLPQVLITLAAWPLVVWLGDYRVILWLMIGKAVMSTAMTFAFAHRPYRWAWERESIQNMLSFGWPLLATGFVMFGSQQMDQILVGAVFSLDQLAGYALAFSLVSIPWFILGQVGGSLMLPVMSGVQDNPEQFRRQYRLCTDASAVVGVLCTLPLIVMGEQLVTLLFGTKYQGTGAFMAVLGAAAALRFLRFASTVASTAQADTVNQLYSNLWRAASLPLAMVVLACGGNAVEIAACTVFAELLSAAFSMVRLRQRQGVPLGDNYAAGAYVLALILLELGFALLCGNTWGVWSCSAVALGMSLMAIATACFLFPEMTRVCIKAVRRNSGVTLGQFALK